MTLHPIQPAIAELLDMLGFKANVDRSDPRLGTILGKEDARKLRGWCGDYLGTKGKPHPGRIPRNINAVRSIFERLISRVEPSLRHRFEERLVDLCNMLTAPATPTIGTILPAGDIDGIVEALTAPMWKHEDVHLDVVTRCGTYHRTCESCMSLMRNQVAARARAGTRIFVRIIELGARISMQPDSATFPANLRALVCPAGDHERLSWYGSLVSTRGRDHRIPLVGVIGSHDNTYHVRTPTPSDPSQERELREKQDDVDRLWARVTAASTPREWGLKLVS